MKKTTRKKQANPDRKAKRAAQVRAKALKRGEAISKREKEVELLNKLMTQALIKKRDEAHAAGEEFDPSAVIQEIMEEAKSEIRQ